MFRGFSLKFYHCVVWLGPIGTLIPVPATSPSFRAFYLLLIPGILLTLLGGITRSTFKRLIHVLPAVLFVVCSAVLATLFGSPTEADSEGGSPAARALLFVTLLVFFLGAIDRFAGQPFTARAQLVGRFLKGYAVSLVAGYVLFVGYSTGRLSIETVETFQIEFQTSFAGLMRFSPGSYANEYGVVSSFVLSTIVVLLTSQCRLLDFFPTWRNRNRARAVLAVFGLFTLGALFLSTTRAAYVSFLISLAYLTVAGRRASSSVKFLLAIIISGLLLISIVQQFYDVIAIFVGGYEAFFDESSSASERYIAWAYGYREFVTSPLLGTGFASLDMIHNVYLQLFFGLGVIGTVILLYSAIWLFVSLRRRSVDRARGCGAWNRREQDAFIKIKHIGIIHVAWFAMGNHNLNHFLTWFVLLLVGISPPAKASTRSRRSMRTAMPAIEGPVAAAHGSQS